jgi:hypothetical protein
MSFLMLYSPSYRALAALLLGGTLLAACGGNTSNVGTSTPSSMLGTDSAATKVGGTMPTTDSANTGALSAPSAGSGTTSGTGH